MVDFVRDSEASGGGRDVGVVVSAHQTSGMSCSCHADERISHRDADTPPVSVVSGSARAAAREPSASESDETVSSRRILDIVEESNSVYWCIRHYMRLDHGVNPPVGVKRDAEEGICPSLRVRVRAQTMLMLTHDMRNASVPRQHTLMRRSAPFQNDHAT